MIFTNMSYDEIQRYIRNNGLYTGDMVDRICEILEDNQRELQHINEVLERYDLPTDWGQLDTELSDRKEITEGLRCFVDTLQEELREANNEIFNLS